MLNKLKINHFSLLYQTVDTTGKSPPQNLERQKNIENKS